MSLLNARTLAVALLIVLAPAAQSASAAQVQSSFTTLGTNAGPIPNPERAEPANLLRYGDQSILIDVGDGAAWQLAKAGVMLGQVRTVVLSHLHFDHTGGLFAFLSQRYQGAVASAAASEVTIYGPPGTRRTVDALVTGMTPMLETGSTRALNGKSPAEMVRVVEITDGTRVTLGEIVLTAARNSHYAVSEQSRSAGGGASLSYRFDLPDRSIVYTGDTGPSADVEALAHGADLLVSEIMDPNQALADVKRRRPDIPPLALGAIEAHFRREHLSPREAGLLAARAQVKALVLTHNAIARDRLKHARWEITQQYRGSVRFAEDLQSF